MATFGVSNTGDKDFIGGFYASLKALPATYLDSILFTFPSNQEVEILKFIYETPTFAERKTGAETHKLITSQQTITNRIWQLIIEQTNDEIRREKTGQLVQRINEMPMQWQKHRLERFSEVLEAGDSTAIYDGQNYFSASHVENLYTNSGTQVNKLTNTQYTSLNITTATAPTILEATNALADVLTQFPKMKDAYGKPANIGAANFIVMIPALGTFQSAFSGAIRNTLISDSGPVDNVVKSLGYNLQLVVNPYLTGTTDWYVIRTDDDAKAFIESEEVALNLDVVEDKINRRRLWMAEAIGDIGYGRFQGALMCTFS